jgi:hypothetical protein
MSLENIQIASIFDLKKEMPLDKNGISQDISLLKI